MLLQQHWESREMLLGWVAIFFPHDCRDMQILLQRLDGGICLSITILQHVRRSISSQTTRFGWRWYIKWPFNRTIKLILYPVEDHTHLHLQLNSDSLVHFDSDNWAATPVASQAILNFLTAPKAECHRALAHYLPPKPNFWKWPWDLIWNPQLPCTYS